MEPTFTHTCHQGRSIPCAACAQQEIRHSVNVQADALKKELTVLYLRGEHGPQTVHAIIGGTEKGKKLYEEIAEQARKIA